MRTKKTKAFNLDTNTFDEFNSIYMQYKLETGNTNKQLFKEMLDIWQKHKNNELNSEDKALKRVFTIVNFSFFCYFKSAIFYKATSPFK